MKESLKCMLNERSQAHLRPCTALSCVYEVPENAKLYEQKTDQRLPRIRDADRGFAEKGQEETSVMKMVWVVAVI